MRIVQLVTVVAAAGVILFAPAAPGQGPASHRAAIHKAYNDWVEVTNAKDLDRWVTFLAPDPTFLPPDNPLLRGEKAIRRFYAGLFEDARFSLDCHLDRTELSESMEMAWSTGVCEVTFTGPDGEAETGSSKWAKVWVRMPDGSWKCTLNSWNSNTPA